MPPAAKLWVMTVAGAELPAGFAPAIVILLLVLASDLWVYIDAGHQRDTGEPVVLVIGFLRIETPEAWLLACLLSWLIAFPLYVMGRRR